jgi:light-regulated signal transduction histidine kinase (bacteriophytochrome)
MRALATPEDSATATPTVFKPAFGQADLSNCEREQIHLAGSIQPHGALLLVRETDGVVVQASENAAAFLGLDHDVIGRPIDHLPGDLMARLRPHLHDPLHDIVRGISCHIGRGRRAFDCLVHRPASGGLVIELERAGPAVDLSQHLEAALSRIMANASLQTLADEAARIFKSITGYDRVMVYRFDDAGHGEVFAEAREPALEPFLGNRYPASDIPHIARRLYERNRIRMLRDVEYQPAPLVPARSPIGDGHLDMSLCFLRSSSPIHVQYLKNMGVRGTLVISLLVDGKLWGLISCHHYVPRFIHFEERAVCELLAEAVATRIAALQSFAQAQAELSVRRLEQRMIRAISREGDWRSALFDRSKALMEPVGATGAALLFEGEVRTVGEVPGTAALRKIGTWLDRQPRDGPVATASLGRTAPDFAALTSIASGLLAVPISASPGEYLVWLRPERVQTVTWGGNPNEPHLAGDDPATLSPRRSFAQWHQVVEGTSDPWTAVDVSAARLIGDTVADVVIQFRSVRLLIAEDQASQVRRQVQQSEQAVVIADTTGRILQINEAFADLLPRHVTAPETIGDLEAFFSGSQDAVRALQDVVKNRRAWRGEVLLDGAGNHPVPLLVRADPVFAGQGRSLGFVLMFTDMTERRAAEQARKRFQEAVVEQRRPVAGLLDSKSDLAFRNLLSSMIENAQLAALEIADGVDPSRMPDMLESVRASVARASEMLNYLVLHAARGERDGMEPGC